MTLVMPTRLYASGVAMTLVSDPARHLRAEVAPLWVARGRLAIDLTRLRE